MIKKGKKYVIEPVEDWTPTDEETACQLTAEKWLQMFETEANAERIKNCVRYRGNMLWHMFSYDIVPYLENNAAREAFDSLNWEKAYLFCSGYAYEFNKFEIRNAQMVGRMKSDDVEDLSNAQTDGAYSDVYITAEDFSWTYVVTHEPYIGPYFWSVDMRK